MQEPDNLRYTKIALYNGSGSMPALGTPPRSHSARAGYVIRRSAVGALRLGFRARCPLSTPNLARARLSGRSVATVLPSGLIAHP